MPLYASSIAATLIFASCPLIHSLPLWAPLTCLYFLQIIRGYHRHDLTTLFYPSFIQLGFCLLQKRPRVFLGTTIHRNFLTGLYILVNIFSNIQVLSCRKRLRAFRENLCHQIFWGRLTLINIINQNIKILCMVDNQRNRSIRQRFRASNRSAVIITNRW